MKKERKGIANRIEKKMDMVAVDKVRLNLCFSLFGICTPIRMEL